MTRNIFRTFPLHFSRKPKNMPSNRHISRNAKYITFTITVIIACLALWTVNRIITQVENSEKEKVRLWANAICQKADLVSHTEDFFKKVQTEERTRMSLYAEAQRLFMEHSANSINDEVGFYYNYIIANQTIPVILTDENQIITMSRNVELPKGLKRLEGTVLEGKMLEDFTQEPPFYYEIYGIKIYMYYKESKIYTDLRNVLDDFNRSFLSEITNNSVFVPVIITDSTRRKVYSSGNIDSTTFDNSVKLRRKLSEMESYNAPIEISLPDGHKALVFYEPTELLNTLRWMPLLYVFISFVLIIVAYYLFRTQRDADQNQIWVGMAKETAHQLGTPISSLMAWVEYFRAKGLEDEYAIEIEKDVNRLETITKRFSKIGSVPELKDEDIVSVINNSLNYLKTRTSKKVTFVENLPEGPIPVPLNALLFEWVIENICKNAIDAMNGNGTFSIIMTTDEKNVYIDLCDTGKGIPNSLQKRIFEPGFTTKKRGWGLGLSLAKRIIKEYHKGKIFVKYSVIDQGTVFRIVLKKNV